MIPESEWIWFGYPQHFICANSCRFRMATVVGSVLVSTVGDLHVRQRNGEEGQLEPIGAGPDAYFETYAFPCDGMAECGCCPNVTSRSEIWGERTANAVEAQKKHMEACRMFAKRGGK